MSPTVAIKSEQTIGVAPPPPGVTPNFEHPASRVLLLRLYTRWFIIRLMNASDYIMISGQLLGIGFSIVTLILVSGHVLAVHRWDIPLTKVGFILKLSTLQGAFLWLAIMCAKVSILLLYLQLSPYQYFRATTYGVMAIIVLYGLLGSFEFLFACRPIARYWDPINTPGSCVDRYKFWMSNAAINSVTDIMMMLLPILMLWHLHIPTRQKIGLIAVFMTGAFVCVTSFIRLHYQIELRHAKDLSWESAITATWSTIELHVGLVCASLPHIKPFLRRHFPKLLGSTGLSEQSTARRIKTFSQATPAALPLPDEDEIWLHGVGSNLNREIPLPALNSAMKSKKIDFGSVRIVTNQKDQAVTVRIQPDKTIPQGDGDSQRAILEAEEIEVTSDVNLEEGT